MKIIYTKHALRKFEKLSQHGINLTKRNISAMIRNPDHIDTETYRPKLIASKDFDKKHILRVVYKIEGGIITVITFYPAEKGRYY